MTNTENAIYKPTSSVTIGANNNAIVRFNVDGQSLTVHDIIESTSLNIKLNSGNVTNDDSTQKKIYIERVYLQGVPFYVANNYIVGDNQIQYPSAFNYCIANFVQDGGTSLTYVEFEIKNDTSHTITINTTSTFVVTRKVGASGNRPNIVCNSIDSGTVTYPSLTYPFGNELSCAVFTTPTYSYHFYSFNNTSDSKYMTINPNTGLVSFTTALFGKYVSYDVVVTCTGDAQGYGMGWKTKHFNVYLDANGGEYEDGYETTTITSTEYEKKWVIYDTTETLTETITGRDVTSNTTNTSGVEAGTGTYTITANLINSSYGSPISGVSMIQTATVPVESRNYKEYSTTDTIQTWSQSVTTTTTYHWRKQQQRSRTITTTKRRKIYKDFSGNIVRYGEWEVVGTPTTSNWSSYTDVPNTAEQTGRDDNVSRGTKTITGTTTSTPYNVYREYGSSIYSTFADRTPNTTPASPYTGYTITGFKDSDGNSITNTTQIKRDITIYPVYAVVNVRINFTNTGGSGGLTYVNIPYGTKSSEFKLSSVPTSTDAIKVFAGYYTASSGGTQYFSVDGDLMVDINFTTTTNLYAQYTAGVASIAPTLSAASYSYDGNPHTIGFTPGSGYTCEFATNADNYGTWSTTIPSRTDAGSTYVRLRYFTPGSTNYTYIPSSTDYCMLRISKIAPRIRICGMTSRKYNGKQLCLKLEVVGPDNGVTPKGTIFYSTTPSEVWKSSPTVSTNTTYSGNPVKLSQLGVTNYNNGSGNSITIYYTFVPDSTCNTNYNYTNSNATVGCTLTETSTTGPNVATLTITGKGKLSAPYAQKTEVNIYDGVEHYAKYYQLKKASIGGGMIIGGSSIYDDDDASVDDVSGTYVTYGSSSSAVGTYNSDDDIQPSSGRAGGVSSGGTIGDHDIETMDLYKYFVQMGRTNVGTTTVYTRTNPPASLASNIEASDIVSTTVSIKNKRTPNIDFYEQYIYIDWTPYYVSQTTPLFGKHVADDSIIINEDGDDFKFSDFTHERVGDIYKKNGTSFSKISVSTTNTMYYDEDIFSLKGKGSCTQPGTYKITVRSTLKDTTNYSFSYDRTVFVVIGKAKGDIMVTPLNSDLTISNGVWNIPYASSRPDTNKVNVLFTDDLAEHSNELIDSEWWQYDSQDNINGNIYYKWQKIEDGENKDIYLLTTTSDFRNVSLTNPKQPEGYIAVDTHFGDYCYNDLIYKTGVKSKVVNNVTQSIGSRISGWDRTFCIKIDNYNGGLYSSLTITTSNTNILEYKKTKNGYAVFQFGNTIGTVDIIINATATNTTYCDNLNLSYTLNVTKGTPTLSFTPGTVTCECARSGIVGQNTTSFAKAVLNDDYIYTDSDLEPKNTPTVEYSTRVAGYTVNSNSRTIGFTLNQSTSDKTVNITLSSIQNDCWVAGTLSSNCTIKFIKTLVRFIPDKTLVNMDWGTNTSQTVILNFDESSVCTNSSKTITPTGVVTVANSGSSNTPATFGYAITKSGLGNAKIGTTVTSTQYADFVVDDIIVNVRPDILYTVSNPSSIWCTSSAKAASSTDDAKSATISAPTTQYTGTNTKVVSMGVSPQPATGKEWTLASPYTSITIPSGTPAGTYTVTLTAHVEATGKNSSGNITVSSDYITHEITVELKEVILSNIDLSLNSPAIKKAANSGDGHTTSEHYDLSYNSTATTKVLAYYSNEQSRDVTSEVPLASYTISNTTVASKS